MSRTRKRILIAALVVLILFSGWFVYFYFFSTSSALRHAEAFLFRRLTVTQVSEEGTQRHFFITNRVRASDDEPFEESFGSDRTNSLMFGAFNATPEPTLTLGMIVDPSQWFQNEQVRIEDVHELEQAHFFEELGGFVDASPKRSLIVVVQGFREAFPSALRKAAFTASILDINTPVLAFDWPGDQGTSVRGYREARRIAEASGAELAEALEIIIREIKPDRLSILANSMGAEVIVNAFDLLYRESDLADAETEITHVVLTAPDADHADFNARFRDQIAALSRKLTVYVSSNDRALLMSRVINRGPRLGESTLDLSQLEEATSILALTDTDSDRITLVDVTPVNRTRNFHGFSLETPEFFDDLYLRLINDEVPTNRRIYRVEVGEDDIYWVLTRGR